MTQPFPSGYALSYLGCTSPFLICQSTIPLSSLYLVASHHSVAVCSFITHSCYDISKVFCDCMVIGAICTMILGRYFLEIRSCIGSMGLQEVVGILVWL
jgi:hypothetical protein